ncbi:MAG: GDP-L-fucose synthase [Alphaproteobacteria bacterium]|nr:GDP-L-fucose synthase [Alphaproteobacteria bacterium]
MIYPLNGKRIFVAGHNGLVGSAIMRRLEGEECELITAERAELDLTRQSDVEAWMAKTKPDTIILAAARVGGINANAQSPASFIHENLAIQTNVIHAAYLNAVEKLLFLGSSCIYPKECPQPMKEEDLLNGALEPTNDAYAIAKIAGLKMCQAYRKQYGCDFISVMPTNLYGINDNYNLETAHAPAAFISRFHEAKKQGLSEVTIWGSGKPLREFMSSDDLADACVFILQNYSDEQHINIGSGQEISILELANMIADIIGYKGKIKTNTTKPDGAMRKLLDCTRLNALGWKAEILLEEGIKIAVSNFQEKHKEL